MTASTWKGILSMLAMVLGPLMRLLTPTIKTALEKALGELWKKAIATSNPIDDLFVGFLFDILGLNRPE